MLLPNVGLYYSQTCVQTGMHRTTLIDTYQIYIDVYIKAYINAYILTYVPTYSNAWIHRAYTHL